MPIDGLGPGGRLWLCRFGRREDVVGGVGPELMVAEANSGLSWKVRMVWLDSMEQATDPRVVCQAQL